MKKFLMFVLALLMLVCGFAFAVSAEENVPDNATVYINEKLNSKVSAKIVDGEVYVCIEEFFKYKGFEVEGKRSGVVYHFWNIDLKDFVETEDGDLELSTVGNITYDSNDNEASFWCDEDGLEFFGLKSTDKYSDEHEYDFSKQVIKVDDDHHYAYYDDLTRLVKFKAITAPEINTIGIYQNKSLPKKITLYDKKGNALEVYTCFKQAYLDAGYKEKAEDVLIIPESKQVSADGVKVSLNGGFLEFDVAPSIINGRTMVPLRVIFEALSATVDWNSETRTVVSKKDDITISLTIDSDKMFINGKTVTLDCPATVIDGRTLVPVRAVSEAFGIGVEWNAENQIVVLRDSKYADIKTVLLYNLSNQIVETADFDTERYLKDGWLLEKPVTMYAADGRTKLVAATDVAENKKVGWFTFPPATMYAPDGRSVTISKNDVESYKAVGWYEYPVTTMYAADGRTQVVATSEVAANKAVGWYTYSQYQAVKYSYLAGNDFRSIRSKYSNAVAHGAYVYPYTDKNGDECILVYISYKIISNYNAYYLHNISKGTTIENPSEYYDRIADQYWGSDKIRYMDLSIGALSAQTKALQGFLGKIDNGVFVDAATLNQ